MRRWLGIPLGIAMVVVSYIYALDEERTSLRHLPLFDATAAQELVSEEDRGFKDPMVFTFHTLCDEQRRCQPVMLGEGNVDSGAHSRLVQALDTSLGRATRMVCFDSPGGLVSQGLAVAIEIRQRGLSTCSYHDYPWPRTRSGDARCYSACSIALMGGIERQGGTQGRPATPIGVHQFRFSNPESIGNQAVHDAQRTYSHIGEIMSHLGVSSDLLSISSRIPYSEIYTLSHQEARAFSVLTRHEEWPSLPAAGSTQSRWRLSPTHQASPAFADFGYAFAFLYGARGGAPFDVAQPQVFLSLKNGTALMHLVLTPTKGVSADHRDIREGLMGVQFALAAGEQTPVLHHELEWALSDQGMTTVFEMTRQQVAGILRGEPLRLWNDASPASGLRMSDLRISTRHGNAALSAALDR